MKNIVLEANSRYAVILTQEGDFLRVSNSNGLEIGDVYHKDTKQSFSRLMRIAAGVAALFLLCFMANFYFMNYMPSSYVDIRINPGVKIILNRRDRVIGIEGINQDGKRLMENITEKETDPQKALQRIISEAIGMGYLEEEKPVRITVAMKNPEKGTAMENVLLDTVQETLEDHSVDVPISAFSIDVQDYKQLESVRSGEDSSTDYSPEWKKRTTYPSICDVRFEQERIIIEFNRDLDLNDAEVSAINVKSSEELLAEIIAVESDKLTVSFEGLHVGSSYRIIVSGIMTEDGTALDPLSARIFTSKPGAATSNNNGNGSTMGSINGNYRNQEEKGNGNAYGLDKKDQAENQEEEREQEQERDDDKEKGNSNSNSNSNRNRNENSEKPAAAAAIDTIELDDNQMIISFNMDLQMDKATVTASPVNDADRRLQGQVISYSNRTLRVAFSQLKPHTNYIIRVNGAELSDSTAVELMSHKVHTHDETPGGSNDVNVKIVSAEEKDGFITITFNASLVLDKAAVTASPVNDENQTIDGRIVSYSDHSLKVDFPDLRTNTYVLRVQNLESEKGTEIDPLKKNIRIKGITSPDKKNDQGSDKEKPSKGSDKPG